MDLYTISLVIIFHMRGKCGPKLPGIGGQSYPELFIGS